MNKSFLKFYIKPEILIILFGIIINICISQYNLNKFDKTIKDYSGDSYNQMTKADLRITWNYADQFRKKLSLKQSFWDSLPSYDRFFLPSILVGTYYHLIDKEIYETGDAEERIVKNNNYKFGILLIQIILFYIAVFFLVQIIKKKFQKNYHIILLLFLSFEPTIMQWHSSLWSESLFITMMVFLFYLIIKSLDSYIPHIFIGILVGLMFTQRAVSFMYIIPVILYYIIQYKKKLLPTTLLLSGFIFFMSIIGFNNFKKSGTFYFISAEHQYKAYYHYFGNLIYADTNNINRIEADTILKKKNKNGEK